MSFRFGGFVDEGLSLDLLGGGAGLTRGKIRVTDRSGASAEIDLRYARSIDDVLTAINDNADIDVSAVAVGDRIRLIDDTGQTAANLRVQEVGGGTTAASLGLSGVNAAASQADGADVLRLYDGLRLDQLNDRTASIFDEALSDLTVQFRDGTTRTVDFRPVTATSLYATGTTSRRRGRQRPGRSSRPRAPAAAWPASASSSRTTTASPRATKRSATTAGTRR